MFNPSIHKIPYGAAVKNEEIQLTFPLTPSMGVKRVFVVLRQIFQEEKEIGRYELPYVGQNNGEDIFKGNIVVRESGIYHYRFEGELEDGALAFFGRDYDGTAIRGDWLDEWQLTVSDVAIKTPDWAKQGITYQIFADRFCKGDNRPFTKNGTYHDNWDDTPLVQCPGMDYKADDFFGGNISGIISKLDYLKSLGVSCIYLSPIFESSSNHRYDTGDYLKVDELFGDEAQFRTLIEKAKARKIHIMLDGVFNHTGADSIYFNKFNHYNSLGAFQSKDSPYYDWFYFNEDHTYACWWGSTVVPTTNKSAKGYRDLVLGEYGVIDKWTKLGVDGWRFDVVDELPIDFTTDLCQKVKSISKDKLLIGEVWEDASIKIAYSQWRPYFMGHQLDSVMNYPFKEAVLKYTLDGNKRDFIYEISKIMENYPKESLDVALNMLDSHDTVRALTHLSGVAAPEQKIDRARFRLNDEEYALAKKRLLFASMLQFTLPGQPCVYYADEVGIQGFEDPLNRGTYPWGMEDKEILSHYQKLGAVRARFAKDFMSTTTLIQDDELLIYKRGKLTIFANANNYPVQRQVNGLNIMTRKKETSITLEPLTVRIIQTIF